MKDRFLPSFSSFSSLHDWGTHFHLHCCSILRKPLSDVNANNSLLIARHSTLSGRSSFVLRHKLFCSAESPCQTNLTPQPIQPSCIPLLEYPLLIALWLCWLKVRRIAQYPICANCSEGSKVQAFWSRDCHLLCKSILLLSKSLLPPTLCLKLPCS